ncbi:hypothetical protein SAMN05421852_1631 [Thermoflavimicrobium dichotomicum]|uniref:Uncharacterized protein n=1 Tax=Thermoflavimicrobium dichotomicum TaxID=46223 RepID=A0A1I3VLN4_9BACL|nr:hypothetical protein SAMN05421852_1631 [Thermoflavimicrobium dichotomicum]
MTKEPIFDVAQLAHVEIYRLHPLFVRTGSSTSPPSRAVVLFSVRSIGNLQVMIYGDHLQLILRHMNGTTRKQKNSMPLVVSFKSNLLKRHNCYERNQSK